MNACYIKWWYRKLKSSQSEKSNKTLYGSHLSPVPLGWRLGQSNAMAAVMHNQWVPIQMHVPAGLHSNSLVHRPRSSTTGNCRYSQPQERSASKHFSPGAIVPIKAALAHRSSIVGSSTPVLVTSCSARALSNSGTPRRFVAAMVVATQAKRVKRRITNIVCISFLGGKRVLIWIRYCVLWWWCLWIMQTEDGKGRQSCLHASEER